MTEEIRCPQCGSKRLYKDGFRYLKDGTTVQRYLCRDCGYRFSDPNHEKKQDCNGLNRFQHDSKVQRLNLKTPRGLSYNRQVGAHGLVVAKNLVKVENRSEKRAAGATAETAEIKGKILEYAWKMKRRGQAESSIRDRVYRLNKLFQKGADLMNPESVETVLVTEKWTQANKKFYAYAYYSFTRAFGIPWKPPKIRVEPKQPFIPLEKELDALISGCGKITGTFLQILKDTGARAGEALKIKWIDVNVENNTISINSPEKGSHSRTIKVSPKTIAMIQRLPKKYAPYLFCQSYRSMCGTFAESRRRLAAKLGNPRLLQIHFHTFRHWKATMEYARTRNILWVKHLLGHKRLENTEVYTHLVNFESEEYHSATAQTIEEAKQLIEQGFEYVCDMNGVKLFRKRK